jgi:hypothetical protein
VRGLRVSAVGACLSSAQSGQAGIEKLRIFLSYSRKDVDFVRRMADALETHGYVADFDQSTHHAETGDIGIAPTDDWWIRLQDMIAAYRSEFIRESFRGPLMLYLRVQAGAAGEGRVTPGSGSAPSLPRRPNITDDRNTPRLRTVGTNITYSRLGALFSRSPACGSHDCRRGICQASVFASARPDQINLRCSFVR